MVFLKDEQVLCDKTIYGEVCIKAMVASLCLSAEEFVAKDLNKDMLSSFVHSSRSSSILGTKRWIKGFSQSQPFVESGISRPGRFR